jgi:hypothetical protein
MSAETALIDDVIARARAVIERPIDRWDECAEVALRHPDGPSAWEALCANGLVPEAWLCDPARWFALPRQHYRRARAAKSLDPALVTTVSFGGLGSLRATPMPTDRGWAALLAATAPAVAEAEALALTVARLAAPARPLRDDNAPEDSSPRTVWRHGGINREPDTQRWPLSTPRLLGSVRGGLDSLPWLRQLTAEKRDTFTAAFGAIGRIAEWTLVQRVLGTGALESLAPALFTAMKADAMIEALRLIAEDTPQDFFSRSPWDTMCIPARDALTNPFAPLVALLATGHQLSLTHPNGSVALSTRIAPPLRARKA